MFRISQVQNLFFLVTVVVTAACNPAHDLTGDSNALDPSTPSDATQRSNSVSAESAKKRVADCVVDTIAMVDALELTSDLEAAINPTLIKDFGKGTYKQVRITSAMQIPLVKTEEFGGVAYSFHGWDIFPKDLIPEGIKGTGLFAVISGAPVYSAKKVFAQNRLLVSEAIFASLTRATEQRTEHVAQGPYDRSWVRIRRSTPNQRLVCDKVTYPDSESGGASFTCVLSKVEWKSVQAYDTDEGSDFCPSP